MILLAIAYLGGVLTILSPCILPVLPFVFAGADRPFRSHGLPMLLGMALAFTGIATLAAVGGGWVVALNEYGRYAAMALLALFGLTLLSQAWAERLSRPLVALGMRLSQPGAQSSSPRPSALLLGVGTGLLWAPCAGPILGLILTGAAINGASAGTSLLLLAYAAGACTSLAAALLFGARVFSALKGSLRTGEWIRRAAGVAVLAGVGAIALGLDTGLLSRLSFAGTTQLEKALLEKIEHRGPPRPDAKVESPVMLPTAAGPASPRTIETEGMFPSLAGATEYFIDAQGRIRHHQFGENQYEAARDLHLVLGPSADGKPVRFRVRLDGRPPLADHGSDIDAEGNGVIDGQRLYQLVRQTASGKNRLFEIEFIDSGAQAYAFTFG